jgi:hypothetical protein
MKKITFPKMSVQHLGVVLLCGSMLTLCASLQARDSRWTEAQANEWYAQQPWPVGANFLPPPP